jgi:DNA-binding transcriptional MocR family regulator
VTVPGLKIDPDAETPVYRQIADGIRRALEEGRVLAGRKLPPTRDLAIQLGVNRNTVVAAYDLLVEEGVARSHTGRGTFLVGAPPPIERGAESASWFTAFSRAVEGPGLAGLASVYRVAISNEGISFAGSFPAPDLMPAEAFRRAMNRVLKEKGGDVLAYGPPSGYAPLREAIAADLRRRGSRAGAEDILITNGSQQAIELVFRAFVDPGDAVVLDEPTYTGALSVLASLDARLVGVPSDAHGMRPDLLERALERHHPRLLYLQPTFHNPTTRVMPEGRRREILDLARRHYCPVVEDDWAGDLRLEGEDLPTLHALDGGGHVIHLSTFSKKLLPGLRIGWLAAPGPVLSRLALLKQIEDHGTSLLLQAALHAFLEEGSLTDHLEATRAAYRRRRDAMLRAIDRSFPEGVEASRPEGGLFVWVTLPRGVDGDEIAASARERGVLLNPGSLFHFDGGGKNTLRLTFSAVTPEQIERGVSVLGALLRERVPGGSREREGAALEAVPLV